MKTFNTFLTESQAHDQAQSMKLEYYGFGRYGRNHIVTHVNHAGRLVPVQKPFPSSKGEDVLLHYEHLEDQVFNHGVKGARSALDILHSMVKNPKMVATQTKIDGSPSIFYGRQNGKFFVATKSMSNKDPKINFTEADIERNHGHAPGLVEKLKAALEHLPKIYKGGDNEIHQGDVMFTKDDVDTRNIKGKPHFTFKPNTVRNAIPVESEEGKKIDRAKFGFATHTKYNEDNERLPASHEDANEHPDVYQMKVNTPDGAGSPDAQRKLAALGGTLAGTHRDVFDFVSQDHLVPIFKQYVNSKVRDKSENTIDGSDFIAFVKQIKQKEVDKLKTPAKKAEKQALADALVADLDEHRDHINRAFIIHKSISDLKHEIIDQLDKQQVVKRFFDTSAGLTPTGPEGYVAIGASGTHKLVKRGEFSAANFAQNSGEWGAADKKKEEPKSAVVTLGRMSPPHKEHANLVDAVLQKANETKSDPYVYVTHTQDNKKNPLSADEKVEVLHAMYPNNKNVFQTTNKETPSIFHVLAGLYKKGYKKVTVVLGDDRTAELETLKKYNGKFDTKGNGYQFDDINIISRHDVKNTRDGTNDGIHASDMRKWAQTDDFKSFKAGMHSGVSDKLAKSLMKKIKERLSV